MPAPRLSPRTDPSAPYQGNSGTTRATTRLHRHLAVLPAHEESAFHLTEREIVGLLTAWKVRDGFRCEETFRGELFRAGLADKAGYLSVFGMGVRRVVGRDDG